MSEGRPNSAGRGYGATWRKRRAEHLARVAARQAGEGWPGGPWCECDDCKRGLEEATIRGRDAMAEAIAVYARVVGGRSSFLVLHHGRIPAANTVDHRRPRRLFPVELQGSDTPGGSDHPDNLRAMAHSHHSRRADDKARRRE